MSRPRRPKTALRVRRSRFEPNSAPPFLYVLTFSQKEKGKTSGKERQVVSYDGEDVVMGDATPNPKDGKTAATVVRTLFGPIRHELTPAVSSEDRCRIGSVPRASFRCSASVKFDS